jgi:hypothetical protein
VVREICQQNAILVRESWINGGILIIDKV